MPTIEYSIPSHNFQFIKSLGKKESQHFLDSKFHEWHTEVIEMMMQYAQFQELLNTIAKAGLSTISIKERLANLSLRKRSVEEFSPPRSLSPVKSPIKSPMLRPEAKKIIPQVT